MTSTDKTATPSKGVYHAHGLTATDKSIADLASRVAKLEAAVVTPTPPPTVKNTEADLLAAFKSATGDVYLAGDYPMTALYTMTRTGVHFQNAPGQAARIVGSGQSHLVYFDRCSQVQFSGIAWVGADVLQNDSNGSSLVGIGPGNHGLNIYNCSFAGSPVWQAAPGDNSRQHLLYVYGDGTIAVSDNCLVSGCSFDGKGMAGNLVNVYHPTATAGVSFTGGSMRNAPQAIGFQIDDAPSKGIVIDGMAFSGVRIGVRHHASAGTALRNSTFAKSVADPWYDDSGMGTFSQSGNTTGL